MQLSELLQYQPESVSEGKPSVVIAEPSLTLRVSIDLRSDLVEISEESRINRAILDPGWGAGVGPALANSSGKMPDPQPQSALLNG